MGQIVFGINCSSNAFYDGVYVVHIGSDLKVINVPTGWQHGELLARGEAIGI
jgi:hypothetical protein